jgi:GH43 family beta-xylosidase
VSKNPTVLPMKKILFLVLFPVLIHAQTFKNPLLPAGADPWSVYKDGFYYYMHTTGRDLSIWKTKDLSKLGTTAKTTVWTPPATGPYSKEIWAPELHFLQGKWYIYFAADDGRNRNHRLYVLENSEADPTQGTWTMKGQLNTPQDKWAIDGSVFEHNGQMYLTWSGWEGDENGRQDIYLCKMSNPWTCEGNRIRISEPQQDWEKHGTLTRPGPDDKPLVLVNEGPQYLKSPNGRVNIIFSASGCWTDYYALGMIYAAPNADLMDPASWKKHPTTVFWANNVQGTYAAGHNSFFKSPDGSQHWILYHANSEARQGCGKERAPRMQLFTFADDGNPVFGDPQPLDLEFSLPKGN